MEYLLSTDCLTKKFKRQTAIDNISLHIRQGEIYGLIGKNGAGKTTFLKMISGLSKPTSGDITFFGYHGAERNKVISRIGVLIEAPGLYPDMSAYDNLKLEKGLYTTGKSFTQALEQIDPSENYAGTPLEGLDAYQRQLKRFDIKVSGIGSDTVSKFFQTSDSAALFPEYVSRAVRQGMEQADVLQKIVATTTVIDGMDYRAIESVENGERLTAAEVAEGASLPTTTVQVKDTLTEMHKRGRMLVASYEAVKFQKLDLFTVTLRQIGNCIAEGQLLDAYAALIGVHDSGITLEGGLTYAGLVDLWNAFEGFNMTTLLVSARDTASILKMTEMQDAIAGNDFHATGRVVTPLGAELIKHKMFPDNTILALDRTCALEKVQAGDVVTDFDKLIDRQLERASITAIAGFSPIFSGAVQMLTHA